MDGAGGGGLYIGLVANGISGGARGHECFVSADNGRGKSLLSRSERLERPLEDANEEAEDDVVDGGILSGSSDSAELFDVDSTTDGCGFVEGSEDGTQRRSLFGCCGSLAGEESLDEETLCGGELVGLAKADPNCSSAGDSMMVLEK